MKLYSDNFLCDQCGERTEALVSRAEREAGLPCETCGGHRKRLPAFAGLGGKRRLSPGEFSPVSESAGRSPVPVPHQEGGAAVRVGPGMNVYSVGNNFAGMNVVLEPGGSNFYDTNSWISGVPHAIVNRDAKNNRVRLSGTKHKTESDG